MFSWIRQPTGMISVLPLLLLLFTLACGAAATATPAPKAAVPAAPKAPAATQPAAPAAPAVAPTAAPAPAAKAAPARPKLERLKVAITPTGYDTNLTWFAVRSGNVEKRPILEYLIGIDRKTGGFIPELATKWEMRPDGKAYTFFLRKGVQFHDGYGEFTAKDVVHSHNLYGLTEGAFGSDSPFWKGVIDRFEVVDDYKVVFHLTRVDPELEEPASALRDLMIMSKAHLDKERLAGYEKRIIGTGPFKYVERKLGQHVLFERVDNHWRQTPEYKELQIFFPPEDVTRLAMLLAGEVQISDVQKTLHKDAVAKGMKVTTSKLPALTHQWHFGGMYFATPANFDPNVPWAKKEVRQAMNMAINRKELANTLFDGKVDLLKVHNYHPAFDVPRGIWNPEWDKQFDELYGYNPTRAKELLAQAGYPTGFSFKLYLTVLPGLPELKEIGEALSLYFRLVGLKAELVELEFAKLRPLYQQQKIHGGIWPLRHGIIGHSITMRQFHKETGGVVYSFHDPTFVAMWDELTKLLDPAERNKIYRRVGDRKFFEFTDMPLFWIFFDTLVDPKFVAEYEFPGTISGFFTHVEYIKLAK